MTWVLVAVLAVLAVGWLMGARRRAARLRLARELAEELLPEIRALMESADPKSPSDGETRAASRYEASRDDLPRVLSGEQYFAVETFYQCLASYRDARDKMIQAFAESDERSLGDRIRAKDRRDRCLKDVYYTGHGAVEKLENLLA